MTTLRTGLESLADALDATSFRLPFPERSRREHDRADLVRSIREYLLPRLRDPDAPVVAALFGPTGSGKSLIINSLAQRAISAPGTVRPATRKPVIWAHRDHAGRYWQEFVQRVEERVGPAVEMIVGDDSLTRNLTLIDTPPFDYVSDGSVVAQDVLSISDLCVFVASIQRYADGDSWDFIRHAQRRGLPILFVLNRLPPGLDERRAILHDYSNRLAETGLLLSPDASLLFAIGEHEAEDGARGLPASAVAVLRHELEELSDPRFREQLVGQATEGAVFELADRTQKLAALVDEELIKAMELVRVAESVYEAEAEELAQDITNSRVKESAGSNGLPSAVGELEGVVSRRAGLASQRAASRWEEDPVGQRLLEHGGQSLWRHGSDIHIAVEESLAEWSEMVEALVAERPGGKRLRRRKRRRAGDRLRLTVLQPAGGAAAQLEQLLGPDESRRLAQRATELLANGLRATLTKDGRRFVEFVGDVGGLEGVSRVLATEARRVAEAAEELTP